MALWASARSESQCGQKSMNSESPKTWVWVKMYGFWLSWEVAYQTTAVEVENHGSFARVRLLGYEDVCSDGVVSDMFEVGLEDVENVKLGV